jgi:hypothetical protein
MDNVNVDAVTFPKDRAGGIIVNGNVVAIFIAPIAGAKMEEVQSA